MPMSVPDTKLSANPQSAALAVRRLASHKSAACPQAAASTLVGRGTSRGETLAQTVTISQMPIESANSSTGGSATVSSQPAARLLVRGRFIRHLAARLRPLRRTAGRNRPGHAGRANAETGTAPAGRPLRPGRRPITSTLAKKHGFRDIVRHEQRRPAAGGPQRQQFFIQLLPGNVVERGERFVEQEQLGLGHEHRASETRMRIPPDSSLG